MPKNLVTLAGWAAALIVALVLFRSCQAEARKDERHAIAIAALRDSLLVAEAQARQRDTVYQRDTLRFTAWRTRYDSTRITDTVVVDSVVFVNRDVADSVIGACETALNSCGALLAAERAVAANLRQQLALERGHQPSFWRRQLARGGVSVGYSAVASGDGEVHHGVGVTVGVKVLP